MKSSATKWYAMLAIAVILHFSKLNAFSFTCHCQPTTKDVQREILALYAIHHLASYSGEAGSMWGAIEHRPNWHWRPQTAPKDLNDDEIYVEELTYAVGILLNNPMESLTESINIDISKSYTHPIAHLCFGKYATPQSGWQKARSIANNHAKREDQEDFIDDIVYTSAKDVVNEALGAKYPVFEEEIIKNAAKAAWQQTMKIQEKIHDSIVNDVKDKYLADNLDAMELVERLETYMNTESYANSLEEIQSFYKDAVAKIRILAEQVQ